MTPARPAITLRPMLPQDGPDLVRIFRDSVEILAEEDYSADQRAAWAEEADDERAFIAALAGVVTLVAGIGGMPVGYATLEDDRRIGALFVAPERARLGVATRLCEALETLARGRRARDLTVEASDTAEPFFRGRGYLAERRNTVERHGAWLGTTTMKKVLAPLDAGGAQQ